MGLLPIISCLFATTERGYATESIFATFAAVSIIPCTSTTFCLLSSFVLSVHILSPFLVGVLTEPHQPLCLLSSFLLINVIDTSSCPLFSSEQRLFYTVVHPKIVQEDRAPMWDSTMELAVIACKSVVTKRTTGIAAR